jgi:hypothetical protein
MGAALSPESRWVLATGCFWPDGFLLFIFVLPQSAAGFPRDPSRFSSQRMPHMTVAVDARQHLAARLLGQHLMDEIRMAAQASILSDPAVSRFDLNRLVEVLQGKSQRVEESIVGLGYPLACKMVREMTIVTDGDMMVTGIQPRVVVILHDVTIGTCQWIVAQIAAALTVTKSE